MAAPEEEREIRSPDPIDRRRFMIVSGVAGAGALLWPDIPLEVFSSTARPRRYDPTSDHAGAIAQHLASSPRSWEPWIRRLDAAFAAAPPTHGDRTVWDVVVHKTQWIRDTRRWLLEGPPEPDWGAPWAQRSAEPSDAAETAWQAAIDDLMAAHDEFVSTLREIPTARLKVPLERGGTWDDGRPVCCWDLLREVHINKWMIYLGFRALIEGGKPNSIYLRMVTRPAP